MRAFDDHQLARLMASAAAQVLVRLRASELFEGRALGRAGDAVSQQVLAHALALHRPNDAVLSEEAADSDARLAAEHVALAVDGVPGPSAVALPGRAQVLSTADVPRSPKLGDSRLRIAVSRTRAPELAEQVAQELGADLIPFGSAGFKAMSVLSGEVDAYLHAGGQYEWDSAAPVGVALAAGLHASRIDGSELIYNRPDPLLPDLLVCRSDLAERLLGAIAAACEPIEGVR
jgi:3'(2'), 5'-bisphosphate nucleotidase